MELREKIARAIAAPALEWTDYAPFAHSGFRESADRILAIPEIKEALEARQVRLRMEVKNAAAAKAMRPAPLHRPNERPSTER